MIVRFVKWAWWALIAALLVLIALALFTAEDNVHKPAFRLGVAEERCLTADLPDHMTIKGYDMEDLAQYAEKLRKEHSDVHIYMVDGRYEVWRTGVWAGKLESFDTLSGARRYVAEYYIQWARNCMGPAMPGELVE